MLTLLYKLQKLEIQEAAVLTARKKCTEYRQLRELKAGFEKQKTRLLQMQEQLSSLQKQIKTLANEIAEISSKLENERIAVYDGSIANIREFNARQTQISALEEKNAVLTAEQTRKQQEYQSGLRQAKQVQHKLEEQYTLLNEQYLRYDNLRQGWQNELNTLSIDKEALLVQIDSENLAWYEEKKLLFAGMPVAKLDINKTCDGCHTMVTPILYKRTVQGERTRCEKCGRYLIIE